MDAASTRIGARHYAGIFVLSCATLAYQIIITRFFSVVLYYHFAFAAISFAMLGLTRGALKVYRRPERFARERVASEFAWHATGFAVTSVAAMLLFLWLPLIVPPFWVGLASISSTLLFIVPFTASGVCITLLLTRLPRIGGWLYAADLSGAAIGCLGVIAALMLVDPVSATLWLAAFSAGAGAFMVRGAGDRRAMAASLGMALVLAAAASVHTGLAASGGNHIGVLWAKGAPQTETLFERWNTYSRVRVTPYQGSGPFGWGFSRPSDVKVDQKYLDIDADAATVITGFDGNVSRLSYLGNDVINAAYLLQPAHDVAVVGVGGGRDILSAMYFGAKNITGIEINPAIFEVLTGKFADFSGHLDRQPGVKLVNAEARSYLNQSPARYDLVQISLIDTWAATAAGGLTLTENRLYTVEAWRDFYRTLRPGGVLSVSRWFEPATHREEFYRLLSIAAAALEGAGVPANELDRHIVALNVGNIVTVITRPGALSDGEWQAAKSRFAAQGFTVLVGPGIHYDDVASTIVAGKADAGYYDSLPFNVTPSTDDNPFFFYSEWLGDVITGHNGGRGAAGSAITVTLLLVAVGFLACVGYVGIPLVRLARRVPLRTLLPPVGYFGAIGMAFMLIEISQMQRLMVLLGHPVYGLAVVLFTLLLFSGLGSATVGKAPPGIAGVSARLAGLLIALLAAGWLTLALGDWARGQATDMRIVVSVALLAPPAFFMGMMFPMGLGAWRQQEDLLPFFWSTNGVVSTFASVLGILLSIELGIALTYTVGACFYIVCAFILLRRVAATDTASVGTAAPASGLSEVALARFRAIAGKA
ncbi:MAG TPA: hypothetical protein VG894_00365 [Bauldia sp.]|nr:hypothetical protein [Bauldia sp.]